MRKLFFATTNENKLKEAREILGIGIEALELQVDEVQTLDPIECVEKKAKTAFLQAKRPILVEDTSLFIKAWGKLPGVFIDYFMKSLGNEGILRLLGNERRRLAVAQTSLCFFDGRKSVVVVGKIKGKISDKPQGENGFGWDPIFMPFGENRTFAQMTDKEKNDISMRKIALEKLKKLI